MREMQASKPWPVVTSGLAVAPLWLKFVYSFQQWQKTIPRLYVPSDTAPPPPTLVIDDAKAFAAGLEYIFQRKNFLGLNTPLLWDKNVMAGKPKLLHLNGIYMPRPNLVVQAGVLELWTLPVLKEFGRLPLTDYTHQTLPGPPDNYRSTRKLPNCPWSVRLSCNIAMDG